MHALRRVADHMALVQTAPEQVPAAKSGHQACWGAEGCVGPKRACERGWGGEGGRCACEHAARRVADHMALVQTATEQVPAAKRGHQACAAGGGVCRSEA